MLDAEHQRQNTLRNMERSAHIDGKEPLRRFIRDILKQTGQGFSGVVDQQVDLAEMPRDLRDHAVNIRKIGEIRLNRHAAQLMRQFLGTLAVIVIMDADGVAVIGEAAGSRGADAAGSAGNQSNHRILHIFLSEDLSESDILNLAILSVIWYNSDILS